MDFPPAAAPPRRGPRLAERGRPRARPPAEALEAERALSGADARAAGTVRVTCGEGFAEYVLAPAAPAFLAAHPALGLEVRAGVRALDLTRGEAEIALRNFRPRERSLVARRLGAEPVGLFAAPGYLQARGAPRSATDLDAHDLVLYDRDFDRASTQDWFRRLAPRARVAFRASSTTLMHAACAAGAGIALLTRAFVRDDPRFVPVLPRQSTPTLELWSAVHADLRASARVDVTLRWLEQLCLHAGFRETTALATRRPGPHL